VLLLGAGGAARGAAVECLRRQCAALWIANRTRATLDELLGILEPLRGKIPLQGLELAGAGAAGLPPGLLVINATSAGLRATDPLPIALDQLPPPAAVYDMIYNPPQTSILQAAAKRGIRHANGLDMLVHQGAKALEIWSGVAAARTAPTMAKAARAAMAESAPQR
jgi:shikimate dehydrogenase